jgi:ribosomal protein S18 acetylase RimI-like enzyme
MFSHLSLAMPFEILPATTKDAQVLDVLINSAYRGDSSRRGWTTEADLLDGGRTDASALRDILHRPDSALLKYVDNGKLIGCVELRQEDDRLYLGMLTVKPDMQNKGIGKKLLAAADDEAVRRQCKVIYMTVISLRKELIEWYIRHGYQLTGERKPFIFEDSRFGEPRQQLEFVVMEKSIDPTSR